MDIDDMLELGGLGVLFGGFEVVGVVLSAVLALVLIIGFLAALLWLDFGALQLVVVAGLMLVAATLGALGGMKIERFRRKLTNEYKKEGSDWI